MTGGRTKMVEIEANGQMINHDFLDPDRMYSSYPETLVHIWEIWWRDAMGPLWDRYPTQIAETLLSLCAWMFSSTSLMSL